MERECKHHGLVEHRLRKDGRWRCPKCAVVAVSVRRRKVKQQLIDVLGGKCERCGYNKCAAALQFHHKDPKEKEFAISAKQFLSYEKCLKEIKKCKLLCANCHAEVENGIVA